MRCMSAYCNSPARKVLLSGPWLSLRSSVCTSCHKLIDCNFSCCNGNESTSESFTLCQFRVCKMTEPPNPHSNSKITPCAARLFQLLQKCATKLLLFAFEAMVFIFTSSTTVFANASAAKQRNKWRGVAQILKTMPGRVRLFTARSSLYRSLDYL